MTTITTVKTEQKHCKYCQYILTSWDVNMHYIESIFSIGIENKNKIKTPLFCPRSIHTLKCIIIYSYMYIFWYEGIPTNNVRKRAVDIPAFELHGTFSAAVCVNTMDCTKWEQASGQMHITRRIVHTYHMHTHRQNWLHVSLVY